MTHPALSRAWSTVSNLGAAAVSSAKAVGEAARGAVVGPAERQPPEGYEALFAHVTPSVFGGSPENVALPHEAERYIAERLGREGYDPDLFNFGALRCLVAHAHGSDGDDRCAPREVADGSVAYLRRYPSEEEGLRRLLAVALYRSGARLPAPPCPACGEGDAERVSAGTTVDGLGAAVQGPAWGACGSCQVGGADEVGADEVAGLAGADDVGASPAFDPSRVDAAAVSGAGRGDEVGADDLAGEADVAKGAGLAIGVAAAACSVVPGIGTAACAAGAAIASAFVALGTAIADGFHDTYHPDAATCAGQLAVVETLPSALFAGYDTLTLGGFKHTADLIHPRTGTPAEDAVQFVWYCLYVTKIRNAPGGDLHNPRDMHYKGAPDPAWPLTDPKVTHVLVDRLHKLHGNLNAPQIQPLPRTRVEAATLLAVLRSPNFKSSGILDWPETKAVLPGLRRNTGRLMHLAGETAATDPYLSTLFGGPVGPGIGDPMLPRGAHPADAAHAPPAPPGARPATHAPATHARRAALDPAAGALSALSALSAVSPAGGAAQSSAARAPAAGLPAALSATLPAISSILHASGVGDAGDVAMANVAGYHSRDPNATNVDAPAASRKLPDLGDGEDEVSGAVGVAAADGLGSADPVPYLVDQNPDRPGAATLAREVLTRLGKRRVYVALPGETLPLGASPVDPRDVGRLLLETPSDPRHGSLLLGQARLFTVPAEPPDGTGGTDRAGAPAGGTLGDLAESWRRVVATRDASPARCPCREKTAPLITAWEAFDAMTPAERYDRRDIAAIVADQWANLRAAQAAQSAAALLPPEGGDFHLDVRTEAEFLANPRPGAVNVPLDALERAIAEGRIPKGRRVVAFCAGGKRSPLAVETLRAAGWYACDGHAESCPIPEAPAAEDADGEAIVVVEVNAADAGAPPISGQRGGVSRDGGRTWSEAVAGAGSSDEAHERRVQAFAAAFDGVADRARRDADLRDRAAEPLARWRAALAGYQAVGVAGTDLDFQRHADDLGAYAWAEHLAGIDPNTLNPEQAAKDPAVALAVITERWNQLLRWLGSSPNVPANVPEIKGHIDNWQAFKKSHVSTTPSASWLIPGYGAYKAYQAVTTDASHGDDAIRGQAQDLAVAESNAASHGYRVPKLSIDADGKVTRVDLGQKTGADSPGPATPKEAAKAPITIVTAPTTPSVEALHPTATAIDEAAKAAAKAAEDAAKKAKDAASSPLTWAAVGAGALLLGKLALKAAVGAVVVEEEANQ